LRQEILASVECTLNGGNATDSITWPNAKNRPSRSPTVPQVHPYRFVPDASGWQGKRDENSAGSGEPGDVTDDRGASQRDEAPASAGACHLRPY
jgi:hypothetical protein